MGLLILTRPMIAMLPSWLVVGAFWTLRYHLTLDERGITLLRRSRPQWTIPWSELQEVNYQPGSLLTKNWDRLLLRTATGVKSLTLDDRLSGCWSDPEAIKAILRARGYAL